MAMSSHRTFVILAATTLGGCASTHAAPEAAPPVVEVAPAPAAAATPHEVAYRSVHIVRRILKGKEPEVVRRSDYITPITNLLAAVDPSKLRIVFYEELFNQPIIDDLCDFLGLDREPADFGIHVLKGPDAEMDAGQYDLLRTFLSAQ